MEKVKNLIIILFAIIIIIILIVLILLNNNRYSQNQDIDEYSTYDNNADQTYIDTSLKEVKVATTYYTVYDCLKNYFQAIAINTDNESEEEYIEGSEISYADLNGITNEEEKKQLIYDLLDVNYIKENKISVNNVEQYIDELKDIDNYSINKMYEIDGETISEYVVYCNVSNFKNLSFLVILDTDNSTYMIKPLEYIDENLIKKEDVYEEIKSVEPNENNTFEYNNIDNEEMSIKYFYNFKNMMINNTESSYDFFNDEYRKKRFGNIEQYKKIITENMEELSKINIKQFAVNVNEDYTEFICKDQFDNLYIFEETAVMNYKVRLDTYTIPTEKFKETYEKAEAEKKCQMNVDKFIQMVNRQDYRTSYGCISEGFRNNYFKAQEDFESYIKDNFFTYNQFAFKSIENRGSNIYVIKVELSNLEVEDEDDKTETKEVNIIMQLNDGIDFEMSFGM